LSGRPPDFFIVGAPRCATTFMHRTLGGHPGVFMPERQHPFQCVDLDPGSRAPEGEWIRDDGEYLDQFAAAPADALIGEACPWYLFSEAAADRIAALNPAARIIIQLRHPVDQLISRHALRTVGGWEDLSLADALSSEPERLAGRRLPARPREPARMMYAYRAGAMFAAQVQRYLAAFPRSQVHFVLLEELRRDARSTITDVFNFLDVAPDWAPDLGVVAPTVSHGRLGRALIAARPGRFLPGFVRPRVRMAAGAAARGVVRLSQRRRPAGAIDPALRRELHDEYAPEIARLGELIGRDLVTAWTR
jgi:hypothetical protein